MSLRSAILGLLSQRPMTGFDLIREFDVSRSVIWPAPQNEVYRVLGAMAEEGAIEAESEGARNARTYAITAAGRAQLLTWLSAESDYSLRYEPILKAVFLRDAPAKLRRSRAEADLKFFNEQLATLEAIAANPARDHRRSDALTMAINFYRGMRDWAEAVLDRPAR
jgi:PadR family transcriptional regulator, regulatory protein AphA